ACPAWDPGPELETHAAGAAGTRSPGTAEGRKRIAAARMVEIRETRLSGGVDLAAVVLAALGIVADNLVSLVDLGKSVLCLGIVRVLLRMVLFRELAERRLDVFRRSVLRNDQAFIGIAHLVLSTA